MTAMLTIKTRKELDIFMNPQRQRLLKCMSIHGAPMTPKQISDILGISPSSVTYHIKKLLELGLIELSHTEMIHGITARFYKRIPVEVNLGAGIQNDLQMEKEALCDYMINDSYQGFKQYLKNLELSDETDAEKVLGDFKNGIIYLTDYEAKELIKIITDYLENHSNPKEQTTAWDISLIAYPREKVMPDE